MLGGLGDLIIKNCGIAFVLQEFDIFAKKNSLEKLIYALGIKGIGEKNAKILAKKYGSLNNLIDATVEELTAINDIGPILAESITTYFKDEENLNEINHLKELGINTEYLGVKQKTHDEITNKKFVITGTLEKYTRDELKEIIDAYGGIAAESVSKKTDAVIVGENPGSKYTKAVDLKIPVWTEKELAERSEIFTRYK